MNASKVLLCTWIFLFSAMAGTRAADNVLITEFMAANNGTLPDENGDAETWIELHNAGTNVVNLDGWSLTDKSTQLTQWRFPATNFPPGTYMTVWASSKNRRVPGAPLHTNFRLNNEGEYLALVRPDGITIASAYPPPFSPQVNGVSYGFPVAPMVTTLIPVGAIARVLVPTDASLDSSWMTPNFD